MSLQKSNLAINFSQGLDLKTDPFQVAPGKMLALSNSVFTTGGLLQKRNGFGTLTPLPDTTSTYLTTFNGDLTAIGSNLQAYSLGSNSWVNKGYIQPLQLSVLPLIRSSTNQSQADAVTSLNGLACTVYTDQVPNGSTLVAHYKFAVADVTTGQNVIAPTTITPTAGVVSGAPKVFILGKYFIIVFSVTITATDHLQYIAINTINLQINAAVDISASYIKHDTGAFDGFVNNNNLYLAWNGADGGGSIRMTYIDSTLLQHNTVAFAGKQATIMSVTADSTGSTAVIYASFYDLNTTKGYVLAVNPQLITIFNPTQVIASGTVLNITATAENMVNTVFYEVSNAYSYDSSIATNFIKKVTITQAGTPGSPAVVVRSVGLASKAFLINSISYFLTVYNSTFQPTYFLIDGSGHVVSKLAYSNGDGYLTHGLPNVTVTNQTAQISYLIKDLISAVNKTQGVANTAGVYSQLGINLSTFIINTDGIVTSEIGSDLHLSGGFLWMYDGYLPVEHGFHLWPDYVETTTHTTGGGMSSQQYFYQVTYEWSDNQGNVFRSAPSIPVSADMSANSPTPITFTSVFTSGVSTLTVSSTIGLVVGQVITDNTTGGNIQASTYITSIGSGTITISLPTAGASAVSPGDTLQTVDSNSVTLNIPTLRLTYKIPNPVTIVIYRWSTAQETYYQVTSVTIPILNDTTVDSVSYVDTKADSSILGNNILYTTGGVIENIAAPATSTMTLYKSRLFLVDAEDKNLLWFSKQVIENTPVEMSDLFTLYVAPTTAAQGNTGPILALSALDDKLIIFKKDAIYYIVGNGPDNTGANNDFSEPVFISSTVGCIDQASIVFTPNGLMFQSDKGIWLLGRDLSTRYIGAPVETYNTFQVLSALNIPGTNQVRFTLSNGVILVWDYYYDQWGTFNDVPGISSTLYQSLHTFIDSLGRVFQETVGSYLDASRPVLMSFTTGWMNLAGLQGFERAYFFYLLGTYKSPHKLYIQIAYDYNPSPSQTSVINPDNFSDVYGSDPLYGSGRPYGGYPTLEQWRIFFNQQKCESFQIILTELFDPQFGTTPGAGLTISGLDMIVGIKGNYPRLKAARSVG